MNADEFENLRRSRRQEFCTALRTPILPHSDGTRMTRRPFMSRAEARQFEQLRSNRSRWAVTNIATISPRELARSQRRGYPAIAPMANVLRRFGRLLRRREAAQRAWERVAPPTYLTQSRVVGLSEDRPDTAIIAVAHSALLYELRRQHRRLEPAIARLAPGVVKIRYVIEECGGSADG